MSLYLGENKVKLHSPTAISYTLKGSPTITSDGIASGFTDKNDYLILGAFNPDTHKWRFTTKVKFNSLTANMSLIDRNSSTRCFQIAMRTNGKWRVNISINGSSKANEVDGSNIWVVDTIYYLRFEYDGSKYYLKISTDNINWTTDITINRADKIYPVSTMCMGHSWYNSGTEKWDGDIYMRYTRFEIDGVTNNKYKLHALEGDYAIVDDRLVWANPNIYLQSSGTQYIDTGINLVQNQKFVIKAQFTRTNVNQTLLGCCKNGIYYALPLCLNNGNSSWLSQHGGSGTYKGYGQVDINLHTFIIDYILNKITIDTIEYNNIPNSIIEDEYSYYLFASNYINNTQRISYIKMYKAEFYNNGTLVRHFVPVPTGLQIGDFTVPSNGMFDIVNQQFYPNQGTGTFTYGKDE